MLAFVRQVHGLTPAAGFDICAYFALLRLLAEHVTEFVNSCRHLWLKQTETALRESLANNTSSAGVLCLIAERQSVGSLPRQHFVVFELGNLGLVSIDICGGTRCLF